MKQELMGINQAFYDAIKAQIDSGTDRIGRCTIIELSEHSDMYSTVETKITNVDSSGIKEFVVEMLKTHEFLYVMGSFVPVLRKRKTTKEMPKTLLDAIKQQYEKRTPSRYGCFKFLLPALNSKKARYHVKQYSTDNPEQLEYHLSKEYEFVEMIFYYGEMLPELKRKEDKDFRRKFLINVFSDQISGKGNKFYKVFLDNEENHPWNYIFEPVEEFVDRMLKHFDFFGMKRSKEHTKLLPVFKEKEAVVEDSGELFLPNIKTNENYEIRVYTPQGLFVRTTDTKEGALEIGKDIMFSGVYRHSKSATEVAFYRVGKVEVIGKDVNSEYTDTFKRT